MNYQERDIDKEHREVMECVITRDADGASRELLAHYRLTGAFLAGLMAEAAVS